MSELAQEQELDENISENIEQEVDQEVEPENDLEAEARALGWKPEGVEGKRALTAEEFLDRKPLFDRIHKLEKTNKESKRSIDALIQHNRQIQELAYKKAMEDLRSKRDEAIELGDRQTVNRLDSELDDLKAKQKAADEVLKSTEADPAEVALEESREYYQNWISKPENKWYERDEQLREYTDSIVQSYVIKETSSGRKPTLDEIYEYAQKKVHSVFPEKFMKRTPVVESGSRKPAQKRDSRYNVSDLDQDTQRVVRTMAKSRGISEEQYIKELEQLGYFSKGA